MFTFRVSSLNYALRCSAVSLPGLIWMFETRSEGWKKRSQTGNSAPLMSSQKNDTIAKNSSQGIMHDKWCGMRWMRTWEHFCSISTAVAHNPNVCSKPRPVCVYTVKTFKCPTEWREIHMEISKSNCGVKWDIYQNRESLPRSHQVWLIMRERGGNKRETGPRILCSRTYKDT